MRTSSVTAGREHPGKGALDQNRRLDFIRQQPAELNAPFFVILFLNDLLWAGELLVAGHLVDGSAEILGRKGGETDGVKSLRPVLCAELKPNRGIRADFADRAPQGEKLFGLEEHAGLIGKRLRKSGTAQNSGGADSQFF